MSPVGIEALRGVYHVNIPVICYHLPRACNVHVVRVVSFARCSHWWVWLYFTKSRVQTHI